MTQIDRERIEHYMAENKIDTFEELARRAGVSHRTIYKVCAGAPFKNTTMDAIAKALGVKPFDIVSTKKEPEVTA